MGKKGREWGIVGDSEEEGGPGMVLIINAYTAHVWK